MNKKIRTSISLDVEVAHKLREIANEEKRSLNSEIAWLLRRYIEKYESENSDIIIKK